jgi:hypothetical protein
LKLVERLYEISWDRCCYTLGSFKQEEWDRIAGVGVLRVIIPILIQMDDVGSGTEPLTPVVVVSRPTGRVTIVVLSLDTTILESHLARLTTHASEYWGERVEKGSAPELAVCADLVLVRNVYFHDSVWQVLSPYGTTQFCRELWKERELLCCFCHHRVTFEIYDLTYRINEMVF